eukprot:5238157-Pyramimonas_sp.AAC.1
MQKHGADDTAKPWESRALTARAPPQCLARAILCPSHGVYASWPRPGGSVRYRGAQDSARQAGWWCIGVDCEQQ